MRNIRHLTPVWYKLLPGLAALLTLFFFPFRGERATVTAAAATGTVYAITLNGNDIYVGGTFHSIGNISANNIAKYNRTTNTWSSLGGGLNNSVSAIVVVGNDVYVGGRFTNAVNADNSNVPVTCIVKWSTASNTWIPLGTSGVNTNGVNGDVSALAVSGSNVYIGGQFSIARNSGSNTVSANSIARWNGSSWAALGTGTGATGNGVGGAGSPIVYALAVNGSDLFVGGSFVRAYTSGNSSVSANGVAKWNTQTNSWAALGGGQTSNGNGVNGAVYALALNGSDLYVGGDFTSAYNNTNSVINAGHLAKWNGSSWSVLGNSANAGGNGLDGQVNALAVVAGSVYAGGEFSAAYNGASGGIGVNGVSANRIARWNGSSWAALGTGNGSTGNGTDSEITAITANGADLYVGGDFTAAFNSGSSKVTAETIVRWNGSSWVAFSSASGGTPLSLVSAASQSGGELSPDGLATAYGAGLATSTIAARTTPLPTSLGGTSVKVRDSANVERSAVLFYASPTQVNFQVPPGTAPGNATFTITASDGKSALGSLPISAVAPSLFAANSNGQGVAAALVLRVRSNGTQSYEPVAQFDAGQNRLVATPIDLGASTDQLFLILFGSGLRYRSSLSAVMGVLGGTATEVLFCGAQGGYVGLDQVNLRIPRSMAGRGDVDVKFVVDGKMANAVRVTFK